MTDHFLKIQVPHYYALRDGRKTFEARRNDRGYEVGDKLILQPWDDASKAFVREPGMEPLVFLVTYVQTFGMADGHVGLSLRSLGHVPTLDRAWVDAGFAEQAKGAFVA